MSLYAEAMHQGPRLEHMFRQQQPAAQILSYLPALMQVRTWQGDMRDLPAYQGPFEAVFFNAGFGNVATQKEALTAAALRLKPGGHVVISHPLGRSCLQVGRQPSHVLAPSIDSARNSVVPEQLHGQAVSSHDCSSAIAALQPCIRAAAAVVQHVQRHIISTGHVGDGFCSRPRAMQECARPRFGVLRALHSVSPGFCAVTMLSVLMKCTEVMSGALACWNLGSPFGVGLDGAPGITIWPGGGPH